MWVYLATVCGKNLPLAKYYTLTGRIELIRAVKKNKRYLFIDEHSILYNSLKEKKAAWLFHILRRLFSHRYVFARYANSDRRPFFKAFQGLFIRFKER